jgi:hypothetical protein
MSALGQSGFCHDCGAPFLVADGHACPLTRRLILPPAYVEQQWRHLQAQLEPARGRHAKPESGQTR